MKRRELQLTIHHEASIKAACDWVRSMAERDLPGGPVRISIGRPRRTLDQNSKLWPMLTDISRQVEWAGSYRTPDDWKDLLTAALRGTRSAPGIEGGIVMFGSRTSEMSKQELSDLIEYAYAFGADHAVEWSEPAKREAA